MDKEKVKNAIIKMEILNNILLFFSCISLMMIFSGLIIFIWFGFVGLKITISSVIFILFSELIRGATIKVKENYIKKLENM